MKGRKMRTGASMKTTEEGSRTREAGKQREALPDKAGQGRTLCDIASLGLPAGKGPCPKWSLWSLWSCGR